MRSGRKLFARAGQLFDAGQMTTCRVQRTTDARVFCMPDGALLPVSNIVFEEARCESPLVAVPPCSSTTPRAVFDAVEAPCTSTPVVQVGARRTDAPAAIHLTEGPSGVCGPPSLPSDLALYDVGAPADLADLFPQLTDTDL